MERNEAEEKMLGFYDYTVVLTYCSVISAVIGIYVSLSGAGHPYIGVMLLLLCGLFDTLTDVWHVQRRIVQRKRKLLEYRLIHYLT